MENSININDLVVGDTITIKYVLDLLEEFNNNQNILSVEISKQ